MKLRSLTLLALIVFSSFAVPARASETTGTIDPSQNFAWGDKIGWINFAPTDGTNYTGLTITDSLVTGYAWARDYGWIHFSPTNGGVTNTPDGVLGGYAWVSSLGWISFNGVTINSHGQFVGVAGQSGTDTARISFDCSGCTVVTDWRPASVRNTTGSAGSGGGILYPRTSSSTTATATNNVNSVENQNITSGTNLTASVGTTLHSLFSGVFGAHGVIGSDVKNLLATVMGNTSSTTTPPANLFDISLALDTDVIHAGDSLTAILSFTNFGTQTTQATIEFDIANSQGTEVATSSMTTSVQTTAVVHHTFTNLTLPPGNYELWANVVYGINQIHDGEDAPFTVLANGSMCGFPWPVSWLVNTIPLIGWFGCVFWWVPIVLFFIAIYIGYRYLRYIRRRLSESSRPERQSEYE